jgi:hypothetical protein
MTILFLAAIAAIVTGFVLYPVFGRVASVGEHLTEKAQEMKRLTEEKARILAAIKDLDFEYKAGKLSDADYKRVRREDVTRAAHVMARMEALGSGDEVTEPREARAADSEIICTSCQQKNPQNAQFCLRCGNRIRKTVQCPKCETELPSEARFCISCGEAIPT